MYNPNLIEPENLKIIIKQYALINLNYILTKTPANHVFLKIDFVNTIKMFYHMVNS